jgi:hypothetical protein
MTGLSNTSLHRPGALRHTFQIIYILFTPGNQEIYSSAWGGTEMIERLSQKLDHIVK